MCTTPSHLYGEVLTLKVMVFEDGVWEGIRIRWSHEGGTHAEFKGPRAYSEMVAVYKPREDLKMKPTLRIPFNRHKMTDSN